MVVAILVGRGVLVVDPNLEVDVRDGWVISSCLNTNCCVVYGFMVLSFTVDKFMIYCLPLIS